MLKRKSIINAISFGALVAFTWGCGAEPEQTSEAKFQVGWVGPGGGCDGIQCNIGLPGHEPMTRLGEKLANTMIGKPFYFDYKEDNNTRGGESIDPIIRGNFATDKPTVIEDFDIRSFQEAKFGVSVHQPWHEGPDRQVFHSLRNFKEDLPTLEFPGTVQRTVDTNKQTCTKVRKVILDTTVAAAEGWKPNLVNADKLFLVGTTTHTIQDSFSPAHVLRTDKQHPMDFCKYGQAIPGLCHHSLGDAVTDDFIWILPNQAIPFMIMKPEAKMAAQTTAIYLLHFHRIISGAGLPYTEINDFLDGSVKLREKSTKKLLDAGSFQCDFLKES